MTIKPSKRIILSYIAFGIICIGISVYSITIYNFVNMQGNDEVRINIAGRLRMLTQKITKDVLLFQDGVVPGKTIENEVETFHNSVHAVTYGGLVSLDIEQKKFFAISAMDNPESRVLLSRIMREWDPFMGNVKQYLTDKNTVSLKYILNNNEHLLGLIDKAVLSIQAHAEKDHRILNMIIYSAIFLVIVSVIAGLVTQVMKLRKASSRLSEIEHLLPICSNCKKIRTDSDHPHDQKSWTSIDEYLRERKDMLFTHTICPECTGKLYPDLFIDKLKNE